MSRILFVALLLFPISIYGQSTRTRYVVWVTPTGNHNVTIDGIAVGVMALPARDGQLEINGINIEVLPVAVFTLPGSMILTLLNIADGGCYAEAPERVLTTVNGLSISGGMFEQVEMNGFSMNFNSYVTTSNGLEMSLNMNSNFMFSGLQFGMWGNRAVQGNGLQMGLFNSCSEGRVIQIGMLNRIGKRVLPLINFSFKGPKRIKTKRSRRV